MRHDIRDSVRGSHAVGPGRRPQAHGPLAAVRVTGVGGAGRELTMVAASEARRVPLGSPAPPLPPEQGRMRKEGCATPGRAPLPGWLPPPRARVHSSTVAPRTPRDQAGRAHGAVHRGVPDRRTGRVTTEGRESSSSVHRTLRSSQLLWQFQKLPCVDPTCPSQKPAAFLALSRTDSLALASAASFASCRTESEGPAHPVASRGPSGRTKART